MAAIPSVNFMINDHGDKGSGFRLDFALDKPYKSILQRNGVSFEDLLQLFRWDEENAEWVSEYSKPQKKNEKLARFRRKVSWCVCGWREVKEDFGRGDVSCLRDIRVPLVTSRSPMRAARDEFNG